MVLLPARAEVLSRDQVDAPDLESPCMDTWRGGHEKDTAWYDS